MAKYSKYRVVPKEKLDAISKVIQEKAGVSGGLTLDGMKETANGLYPTSTLAGLIARTITEFDIPKGVTTVGANICNGCNQLNKVTFPDGVKSIGSNAFAYCSLIMGVVTLPNTLTTLSSQAFRHCNKVTRFELGNSLKTIGERAFEACSALTEMALPNTVTSIASNTFNSCTKLTKITCDFALGEVDDSPWGATKAEIIYLRSNTEGLVFTLNNEGTGYIVTGFEVPEGYDPMEGTDLYIAGSYNKQAVISIAPNAFNRVGYTWIQINSIRLPNTLTSIGDFAFSDQSLLSSITLPGSITDIGANAFAYTSLLTDIYVPWAKGEVANAPWGAENATIHYNHTT